MLISLTTNAVIDAECVGSGRLSWAWVFICPESAALMGRSEPMFKTRAAALRAGAQIMRFKQNLAANVNNIAAD